MKDINDLLLSNKKSIFLRAFFNAKPYSPEGIIHGTSLWDEYTEYLKHRKQSSEPYPWIDLTEKTGGIRKREVVVLVGGSGVAKTTFAMEIHRNLMSRGHKVAGLYLESSPALTVMDMLGPVIGTNLRFNEENVKQEDQKKAFQELFQDKLFLMENNWNGDWEAIKRDIRYFKSLGCSYVILDHVSRLVSGMENGDERRALDNIAHQLKAIAEELSIGVIAVSHLKRPDGKGHEEGAQTSLAQLRGSAGIAQLADIVIGLERDGQAEDERLRNTTTLRILKNRWLGITGKAGQIYYHKDTTRLEEIFEPDGEQNEEDEDEISI